MTENNRQLVVAVDIGTSKVVALVGAVTTDGAVTLIGEGVHPCTGLKKGVVVNVDVTVQSIREAVAKASQMAVCEVAGAYVGIAGSHIRSYSKMGKVAINGSEVTEEDMDRVLQSARTINLADNEKILHVVPQEYRIDDHDGIRHPKGMSGVSLEVSAYIITGAINSIRNIETCIKRCDLEVDDLVLEQLASAHSCLTEDERELGVCLVDIGGGTTDIAIFKNGSLCHTSVIPIAGDQVTSDLSVALRTTIANARQIKERYACALPGLVSPDEVVELPGVADRPPTKLARQTLAEVVEPRYEELFGFILEDLRRNGLEDLINAGVVLTGGSSKMQGARELAEEVFNKPVRIGNPRHVAGLEDKANDPIYATSVGLLLYAAEDVMKHGFNTQKPSEPLMEKISRWFKKSF